jgi:uncharacterized membrane protein
MHKPRKIGPLLLGILFVAAGANHFILPDMYLKIMPPYLPWHYGLVLLSGAAEILLGLGMFFLSTRSFGAWGLIALLIAVFPANIYMAMNADLFSNIPVVLLWLRLPLQFLLIYWVFQYTRKGDSTSSVNP